MRWLFIQTIIFYQKYISQLKPQCCRFYPSCSEYSKQAIERFGIIKGLYFSLIRILKCQPFYKKNFYDPIPEFKGIKKDINS